MPDLNLIDDEEGLSGELPEGAEEVIEGGGGGGGATKTIVMVVVVLVVLLGGIYALNEFGVINLWGGEEPQVMTVEDQFSEDFYNDPAFAEQPMDSSWMTEGMQDDVALLETTPLDESGQQDASMAESQVQMLPFEEDAVKTPAPDKASTSKDAGSSALSGMKGDFTIQVVAYREQAKAKKIMENLEFSGYPAFIEKVQMQGGDWYTVRIGKYATRSAAKEAVKTFAASIQENYFIDKIRSK